MRHRNLDPGFDEEEIENQDPLGEDAFEEEGFLDAPAGGPAFAAPDLVDKGLEKRPDRGGQKMAGIPEEEQHELNTPSEQRPDTEGAVIRERGGQSKGDPAVGGTRPE